MPLRIGADRHRTRAIREACRARFEGYRERPAFVRPWTIVRLANPERIGATAMNNNGILLPIVLQIVLAAETYLALGWARSKVLKAKAVDARAARLDDNVWPDRIRAINNNVKNQFEVPVLFYAVAIILWQLGAAGALAQTLAWLFVASRVVHTLIHTGGNRVKWRFLAFAFGLLMVLALAVLVLIAAFRP
jgi:hypothetical protein